MVAVVIEGKVVNLGAYNRTMSGTWSAGRDERATSS